MWKKIIAVLLLILGIFEIWWISLPPWATSYFAMLCQHRPDFMFDDVLRLCDLNIDGTPELLRFTGCRIEVFTIRSGKVCFAGSLKDTQIKPYRHIENGKVLWVSDYRSYYKYGYDWLIGIVTLDDSGKVQTKPFWHYHEYYPDWHECYYECLDDRIGKRKAECLYDPFYEQLQPAKIADYSLIVNHMSGADVLKWLCSYGT